MSDFKIEKNVPLPERNSEYRGKYPFLTMEVGDSFFIPNKTITAITSAIHYVRRLNDFKYCARSVDGGVRVWRVK